jgi:ribosomal protein S18 acetylase RimI-like enzyme
LIAGDYPEFNRLRFESIIPTPAHFGSGFEKDTNGLLKLETVIRSGKNGFVIGAFSKNRLVGICGFAPDDHLKSINSGEIQVFISKDHVRQGIGKKLVQICVKKAFENSQFEEITLNAISSTADGANLYKTQAIKYQRKFKSYLKMQRKYFSKLFYLVRKKDPENKIDLK